jgi:nucleoside-diphosphate-sugar epimerase
MALAIPKGPIILVTGVNGFIGSHVADQFSRPDTVSVAQPVRSKRLKVYNSSGERNMV